MVNEIGSDHPSTTHRTAPAAPWCWARDGVAEPNLVWKDTVLVRAGQTVDILFDVNNPGAVDGPLPHR